MSIFTIEELETLDKKLSENRGCIVSLSKGEIHELVKFGLVHLSNEKAESKEFKPCPFCGNNYNIFADERSASDGDGDSNRKQFSIHCYKCDTESGYHNTRERAVAFWNKRA